MTILSNLPSCVSKLVAPRLNRQLVMLDRERIRREASPSAAVLDSQIVKTTESGRPRGYDAGKKVKGRKRQALVDTSGRALVLDPQPADIQDRDGAVPVLKQSRRSYSFIAKAFADAGYAGARPASATLIAVEIVRKPPGQIGLPASGRRAASTAPCSTPPSGGWRASSATRLKEPVDG